MSDPLHDKHDPTLEAQIAWVGGMRDEHHAAIRRNGEAPGDGSAMISALLRSLETLRSLDRKIVVCNRHGFAGLDYCPQCTPSAVEPTEGPLYGPQAGDPEWREHISAVERNAVIEECATVCDGYDCDHPGGLMVAAALGRKLRALKNAAPQASPSVAPADSRKEQG